MTPEQRAELDRRVAQAAAQMSAERGTPLSEMERDAIAIAMANSMTQQQPVVKGVSGNALSSMGGSGLQAPVATQTVAPAIAQQAEQAPVGWQASALSSLAGKPVEKPVVQSAPVTIPVEVTGVPQNEQEWFEAQKAAQQLDRRAAETQQQRIDDYNRVNKPLLGISRLGGADHTNLDRYNRNIDNRENLIIADTRERNAAANLANRAEFDKVANAVAQAEMERINANLPDNTQGVSLESVRNSMFPGYKPGHGIYSNEDLLGMLYGAKVPSEYINALSSKLTPYMDEEERVAQLNGKPAPTPTNTVNGSVLPNTDPFYNVVDPKVAESIRNGTYIQESEEEAARRREEEKKYAWGGPAPYTPTNTAGEMPQLTPDQFFNVVDPKVSEAYRNGTLVQESPEEYERKLAEDKKNLVVSYEPTTVNPIETDAIDGVGGTALGITDFATQAAKMINGARQTAQPSVKGTRQNTLGVLAGDPAPAAQPVRTATTAPAPRTTASTQQVVTQQPAQYPALQIGSRGSYIPSTGFTTPNNAGGAQITISPVEFGGDNGGLQYGAMNALYADPKRAPSLGELLAFSSIMQGKKDLGGLDTITATMQSADKMNAYAAQQNIAGRMQQLMQGGASADEARYQAISEEMLRNGQGRGAAAITIPEYAKAADAQAARNLDTALTAGGNYQANSAFGYTPLGIGSVTANSDGSYNMNVGGQNITGVAPEYTRMSVYGAIKGDGSGSKLANDYDLKYNDKLYSTTVDSMKAETEAAKILYDINKGAYGDPSKLTPEQKIQLAYEIEKAKWKGRNEGKAGASEATSTGNKTGIDPKWF